MDQQLLLTILIGVAIVVMIGFSVRNSRKRQRDAADLQQKLQPGAEVMTTHGIYGRLISLDDDKNEAVIETTPGTRLRLHRQTISRVVEPEVVESTDELEADAARLDDAAAVDVALEEPEYGERASRPAADDADRDAAKDADGETATSRGRKGSGE